MTVVRCRELSRRAALNEWNVIKAQVNALGYDVVNLSMPRIRVFWDMRDKDFVSLALAHKKDDIDNWLEELEEYGQTLPRRFLAQELMAISSIVRGKRSGKIVEGLILVRRTETVEEAERWVRHEMTHFLEARLH